MTAGTPKPLGRVARKRLETQQEILDTALQILDEQGVERLTLAAVCERLGFTKPAIYHYFRSKEALVRSLVLELVHQETAALIAAVSADASGRTTVLGVLIRAFYRHYRQRLNAFRLVYCQFQLMDMQTLGFDRETIRKDINPRTQHLFDVVSSVLNGDADPVPPATRRLAFSAYLAAIGLIDAIGVTDAGNDPLRHSDADLLDTLVGVFDTAAARLTTSL